MHARQVQAEQRLDLAEDARQPLSPLLLAGMIWLSLGIGAFVTLSAVIASPTNAKLEVPQGIQWIGLAPAAIGVSHLLVYLAGKNKEK